MKSKTQTLIIIILVILLALSGAYILLGPNGIKSSQKGEDFFDDMIELQSTLSYYVGSSYSDSFGVYTKEEILSGKIDIKPTYNSKTADGEQIKDNQDNLLPTLIEEETLDYKDDKKAYKLNMENVETTLGVSIDDYEGVTFYVVDGDLVKVKLDSMPDWWSNNFNSIILK